MSILQGMPDAMRPAARLPIRPVAFLWRYVRLRPWHFVLLLALVSSAAGCAVAVQYGMKLLVDAMTVENRQSAHLWPALALFLGMIVVENGLWRLGGWLGCHTVIASCVDIRIDLFRHLTGHPMRYFNQHFAGALGNRITAMAGAAGAVYGTLVWRLLPPSIDFLGAVLLLYYVAWPMALALVIFVVLVGLLIARFGIRGRTRHQHYAAQAAQVGGELVDVVSNVWTIKAFTARERESQRLAQKIAEEAQAQRRSWLYLEKTRLLHDVCLALMAGGMLIWVTQLWVFGRVTAGDVVLVSALTFRILHGSRDLALALVDSAQQLGVMEDGLHILAQPHGLDDPSNPLPAGDARIDFVDVSFAYPDGRTVFEHLNLQIPAGQKVGIVGHSGAGKSTLLALLQRQDDVQGGQILIGGYDIRAVSQDSLRALIAVVPQETALFNRSIAENIRYGCPGASDEAVRAAARHAYCDDFIRELPQGYDTLVGERGVLLSGGQRQRLGLARAFLKDAPILILDEATSALDTHSEAEIQVALANLTRGRTVLAVAHRLSTVNHLDRILVLHKGRILEDGPPAKLRQLGGAFESLWRAQVAEHRTFTPAAPASAEEK
ncbi:MAG: ABC transporter ATP-binding protein [Pseudomonadota bacterium]